jgi:hypothetical protein
LAQSANVSGDTETTQEAMTAIGALEISIDQLEFQRFGAGGGIVGGLIVNKTLDPGTSVTLRFTFYGTNDDEIGSDSVAISVGEVDTPQLFEHQFDSTETVGGYSYELTIG